MSTSTETEPKSFTVFGVTHASERAAIIDLLDKVQVAESCAGRAITAWIETCKIPALRGGLKIIAERETFHGRVFQQRIRDLGADCAAELDPFSQETEACIVDPGLTDLEKLTSLVERNADPELILRPILDFAEMLTEDLESKEALKLYYADEMSSGTWFRDTCQRLTADTAMPKAA